MAGIHTYLKEIRIEKGLTQEDVATKIGLTRQAISSYESGKRQPGIDILMKLAEIYEVSIDTILYGNKKAADKRNLFRIAIIVAVAFFILQISAGVVSTLSFLVYPIEEGSVPPDQIWMLEKHFDLISISNIMGSIAGIVLLLGSIVVMAFDLSMKIVLSWKIKISFFFVALGVSWVIAIILSAIHPFYTIFNFIFAGPIYFLTATILLIIDLIIAGFRNRT